MRQKVIAEAAHTQARVVAAIETTYSLRKHAAVVLIRYNVCVRINYANRCIQFQVRVQYNTHTRLEAFLI